MKDYDVVELICDRKKYNDRGVYKGMQGVAMEGRGKLWLVVFDGDKETFDGVAVAQSIDLAVEERDLKIVSFNR